MTLAPDELEFCDRQAEPEDPGDVTFCDEQDKDEEQDVVFCPPECGDPETLTIGGTETPSDGSIYSVSGGTGPYNWSIGKGSIATAGPSSAKVTVSGQCGSTTITVTDKCGNTGEKEVRLPTGTWVQIAYDDFRGDGCGDWGWSQSQIHVLNCYSGRFWYKERTQKHAGPDCNCYSHSCPPKICTSDVCCLTLWERWTYEWQCP